MSTTEDLVTTSLAIDDLDTRACGPAAITIGMQTRQAAYRGRPASGRFRVTAAVPEGRPGDGPWRLAGVHLSAIVAPPGERAEAGRG
jgi:hypothetical protein